MNGCLDQPRNRRRATARSIAAGRLLLALLTSAAVAQNLLPNPDFDQGTNAPAAWQLEGQGLWLTLPSPESRVLQVTGQSEDSSLWRTASPLEPGSLYALRFRARREPGATGGTAVAGPDVVNRDFPLGPDWESCRLVFRQPDGASPATVRLGQWHVRGAVQFADAGLWRVLASHTRLTNKVELGEGESVRDGVYRFQPQFGWEGANYHRPLLRHQGAFNSDRFLIGPGGDWTYRFEIPGSPQRNGRVRVALNHYESGRLLVEAAKEASSWQAVGVFGADRRSGTLDLPQALFPAATLLVRLRLEGPGALQVNTFEYESTLGDPPADTVGATHFLEILEHHPDLAVDFQGIRYADESGFWQLALGVTNRSSRSLPLRASLSSDRSTPFRVERTGLSPGRGQRLRLLCAEPESGLRQLQVLVRDAENRMLLNARTQARLAWLDDRRPGHTLPGTNGLAAWWCEGSWKIGRDRGLPMPDRAAPAQPVSVSLARGEYEPAQLVLRPSTNAHLQSVRITPFLGSDNQASGITLRVDEVGYVEVTVPTDETGTRGWYPDPLPPLQTPLPLVAQRNQPLWLTFHAPPGTPAGEYRAALELTTTEGALALPLAVHVYDFDLPAETHLRSALGLGSGAINRYHGLTRRDDQVAVFEKYLANFAEHRISPYSFYDHAPIDVQFPGDGTNRTARVDFERFDEFARRWLAPGRFNTFQLPLVGMGGGTFHDRHLGNIAGFQEGTPEHARLFNDYLGQVERHLRDRGWLQQAFTYWFDEPDPKDYAFVVAGLERLKAAAPGIRRMLTEQPEPDLLGHVDIWCALTPEWTPEKVKARRDAGEEVWWYICTAPKAPYVTEFIDHPGTELRLWPWQAWQYHISGLLVWATIYWTSPLVYPEPQLQDPWRDPMSWVSGYGFPVGHRSPWGNGDGRFLYPPRRDPNPTPPPCLDGPINSIRWENLRDGMEDYEYLWLLRTLLDRLASHPEHAATVAKAQALLTVPPEVSRDLTHFTLTPQPLLEHRARVARAIEQLQRLDRAR